MLTKLTLTIDDPMIFPFFLTSLVAAYLYGSINLGILLTRWVKGIDLLAVGTGRAGTANVSRALGKGWAFLVFLFDLSKSLMPLILLGRYVFPASSFSPFLRTVILFLVAFAAVLGHCRPVFHRFRGGGGVVTTMGAFFYFIPVEFFVSMLLGFFLAMVFFRKKEYSLGQWTPIIFLALTPVITLVTALLVDIPLAVSSHGPVLRIGGKPWYLSPLVLALGLGILLLNPDVALNKMRETRKPRGTDASPEA